MVDEEMNGDCSRADEAAGESADGTAEHRAGNDSDTNAAAVFDAVALDAGVRADGSLADYVCFGTEGAANVGMEPVAGAVGQYYDFRLEAHGAATAKVAGGDIDHAAIDLRAGGDEDLTALKDIHGDGAAEAVSFFGVNGGEPVEEVDPDFASGLEFARLKGAGMDDVAVGVRSVGILIGIALAQYRRPGWGNLDNTVVGSIAGLRSREVDGRINGGGPGLALHRGWHGGLYGCVCLHGEGAWRDGMTRRRLGRGNGGGEDDIVGRGVRDAGVGIVLRAGLGCILCAQGGGSNYQQT